MFCGDWSLIKSEPNALTVTALLCKCWHCPHCFPRRLTQLAALARSGNPATFITLTVDPSKHESPQTAAQALVLAWRNIRQRAKRDGYAEQIPFLAVFEETKRGWPHLHILCRAPFIPHAWLSARTQDYLDSPIVDIRRIYDQRHAARYIAKYVSKGPAQYEGTKRYFRSQDYVESSEADDNSKDLDAAYWISRNPTSAVTEAHTHRGWKIEDNSTGETILVPTETAAWIYPHHDPPATWRGSTFDGTARYRPAVARCSACQGSTRCALRGCARAARALDKPATPC